MTRKSGILRADFPSESSFLPISCNFIAQLLNYDVAIAIFKAVDETP
jgi:hypothetical protein